MTDAEKIPQEKPTLIVYYDGDCPFCQRYAMTLRLRDHYRLFLRNARDHIRDIQAFRRSGYDINQGMIVKTEDSVLHGNHAAAHLERLAGHPIRAFFVRYFYPLLKAARLMILKLLGRPAHINY